MHVPLEIVPSTLVARRQLDLFDGEFDFPLDDLRTELGRVLDDGIPVVPSRIIPKIRPYHVLRELQLSVVQANPIIDS